MKLLLAFALLAPTAFAASPTLKDVLGPDLSPDKVRGIYRYSCDRTFHEGEGVDPNGLVISCLPNQRFGLIKAPYAFYLYDSKTATNGQEPNNFSQRPRTVNYIFPICQMEFPSFDCPNAPELRFGLYGEKAGIFQVGVNLTSAPEVGVGTTGFAAMPDAKGRCPRGLVGARPYRALPRSITEGSLGTNPPSNFTAARYLESYEVEARRPAPMIVKRLANAVPCNGVSEDPNFPSGSCARAELEAPQVVQAAPFTAQEPVVCVIPTKLLEGAIP